MRKADIERDSKETKIKASLNIDGSGEADINTGIGFLDHMLELFAFWGHFDLSILTLKADLKVDIHHTNEDVGIVLGQVFKKALGDKAGIQRNGFASFPMENVTAHATVDISGRGSFTWPLSDPGSLKEMKEGYKIEYAQHFFDAFSKTLGMNLNITITGSSPDLHTTLEPIFKALGKALGQATGVDPRRKGIPSTKGVID